MNLRKLFIPKEKAQTVIELESYSVEWFVKTGWADQEDRSAKMFVKSEDAKEFEKQLKESAKFINAYIRTNLFKN